MKEMIGTLKDSISAILSLLALMFALLVFFSLFGMRLFGRRLVTCTRMCLSILIM